MISRREALAGAHEVRPRPAAVRRPPAAKAALLHGTFLLVTAIANLSSRRPAWGANVCQANVGAALIASGARGKVARELRLLGYGAGLGMALVHFRKRRFAAGVAQLAFFALWVAAGAREVLAERRPPEPAFA
jgi:hypothetical protein